MCPLKRLSLTGLVFCVLELSLSAQEPQMVQVAIPIMSVGALDPYVDRESIYLPIGLSKKGSLPTVQEMTGPLVSGPALLQRSGIAKEDWLPLSIPTGEARYWEPICTTWAAPNFYSHPLYFEQVNLERYGTRLHPCFIPIVSYGKFISDITALPARTILEPPHSKHYSLGHWRPGNNTPHQIHWWP